MLLRRQEKWIGLILAAGLAVLFLPIWKKPFWILGNYGDIYSYHYPLRHLIVSTLQEGRLPFWNPYIFSGIPLMANPQAALFYPPSILFYFLPLSMAFNLSQILHVAWGLLGIYLLGRSQKVDPVGCSFLGFSLALSPFWIYRIPQGVPTILHALAWTPWVWMGLLSKNRRFLGLAAGLQFLSGHIQFTLIQWTGMLIFCLFFRSYILPAVQAATLLAVLTCLQWVPTLEFLGQSVRTAWPQNLFSGAYSLLPSQMILLIQPGRFGNALDNNFTGTYPSVFFETCGLYMGLIPLLLAVWGLLRGSRKWPVVLALAGLILALGLHGGAFGHLLRIPPFSMLRVPARFSFLILLGLWILSGQGWQKIRQKLAAHPLRGAVLLSLSLLTFLNLWLWDRRFLYVQDPKIYLAAQPEIAELMRVPFSALATHPDIPNPNKCMMYRLNNATGYEAFYPARTAAYAAESEKKAAADPSRTYLTRWDTPEMSELGVRYYLVPFKIAGTAWKKAGGSWIYINPQAKPILRFASGKMLPGTKIVSPEHWTASLPASDIKKEVILAQTYYPGWKAWVGGKPHRIFPHQSALQKISLEPDVSQAGKNSSQKLHWRYFQRFWLPILLLSLSAIVMIIY